MKTFTRIVGFIFLFLWLIVAVPVSAATISNISPDVGYTGDSVTVDITGTNFTETKGSVWLEMGSDEITGKIVEWDDTAIECKFTISTSKDTGVWDVVVRVGSQEFRKNDAFTITEELSLSSISPVSAQVDDDDVDFTLTGTGLSDVTDVFLHNDDYDDIYADLDDVYSDEITGTFDLTDTDEDTYDVCVVDSHDAEECDLSFKITTDAVGSIEISSSPSGASIYVDGSLTGTTPDTVDDLVEGSYKIVLKKSGYTDWGKIVKVTAGDTSTVDADLEVMTTTSTTVRTTAPTTVKTIAKSTLKVPTSWPSDTPATTASPVDPTLVIGAAGIGIGLAVTRRQ